MLETTNLLGFLGNFTSENGGNQVQSTLHAYVSHRKYFQNSRYFIHPIRHG